MSRRKGVIGICHLCQKNTTLSFEHIPPSAAFNKYTKYRTMPFLEFIQESNKLDYKPSARLQQGGLGDYCLCRECNSFLGNQYVPSYIRMALGARHILLKHNPITVKFDSEDVSPLRFLKQVLSIFICINKAGFGEANPDLLNFIKHPDSNTLPDKFRVFLYLNGEGKTRNLALMYMNTHGLVSEMAFPPLGMVLAIESNAEFGGMTEITHFKDVPLQHEGKVHWHLNNLPTYSPFPLDYRPKEVMDKFKK